MSNLGTKGGKALEYMGFKATVIYKMLSCVLYLCVYIHIGSVTAVVLIDQDLITY